MLIKTKTSYLKSDLSNVVKFQKLFPKFSTEKMFTSVQLNYS